MKTVQDDRGRWCSQKEADLKKGNRGFYCNHCCKTVVDMRSKSIKEIYNLQQGFSGGICGIYNPYQVTKPKKETTIVSKLKLATLIAGIISGVSLSGVYAQNDFHQESSDRVVVSAKELFCNDTIIFRGKIVDSLENTEIPMIRIQILGDNGAVLFSSVTNFSGEYEFQLSRRTIEALNSITLIVLGGHFGFEDYTHVFETIHFSTINTYEQNIELVLDGSACMIGLLEPEESFFRKKIINRVRNFFRFRI